MRLDVNDMQNKHCLQLQGVNPKISLMLLAKNQLKGMKHSNLETVICGL